MDTWDQDKLETVVTKKHGAGIKTTTDIVCKYFIEAIEQRKYGWFWECPNGGDSCKYRHALPPGYILKQKTTTEETDEESGISLEEFLEGERRNLTGDLTPVTAESFAKWKAARIERLANEKHVKDKKKQEDVHAGRMQATGRELFALHTDWAHQDDDEAFEGELLKERQQDFFIDEEGITTAPDTIDESLFLAGELENLDIQ
jgi:DRG Family Regulatory Proteins, Tma46